ncbi:MAG: hypothetical protein AB8B91_21915 [Rubripirellula sp.]
MNFKSTIFNTYVAVGILVCLWFSLAAANGWRAPNFGVLDGSSSGSSGRSYGGSWGGGK